MVSVATNPPLYCTGIQTNSWWGEIELKKGGEKWAILHLTILPHVFVPVLLLLLLKEQKKMCLGGVNSMTIR